VSTNEFNAPYLAPSAASASSYVMRIKPGGVMDFVVNTGATAGWLMLFDAVAEGADGAVAPKLAWQVPANSTLSYGWDPPLAVATGCVLTFSSTGPTTQTKSATCYFGGRVR
jgi:hypothetical protein